MNTSKPLDAAQMEQLAKAVRFLSSDMVDAAASGHPGLPLGMADVATVLWMRHLRFDASDPTWADRDRFVLSAGHGSALLYSLAWLAGLAGVELEQLRRFRQLNSPAAGHPEWGHFPGVETTTGPLGQGFATAVGMAIAEARLREEFGRDLCNHRTWVLAGDGCLMEGISQEAISLAGHQRLSQLVVLWDDNRITIDGTTDLSTSDDQIARFDASGWATTSVDGHDYEAIDDVLAGAALSDRPMLIACRTTIGKGSPTKEGTPAAHGGALGADERVAMAERLDWPHASFDVPDDLVALWRSAGTRSADGRRTWDEAMLSEAGTTLRSRLDQPVPTAVGSALDSLRESLYADSTNQATRVSSKNALEVLVPITPALFGGSADLSGSNGTLTSDHHDFSSADRSGNYLNYGIREHGMAAAMNGLALHGGFVAYGGTFLVFSDYSRPAIRLAALMGLPVVHVLTHDSIGVGEDGPTHQPVEHVCSLRAIPNLLVIRPCDAVETVEAWQVALAQVDRPTALILSRQGLPTIQREVDGGSSLGPNTVQHGAYQVVADPNPSVVLMASGSEVELAIAAHDELAEVGITSTVVSMPCMELFAEQSQETQSDVLGEAPRIAIEASVGQAWQRWLRPGDSFIGMTTFGASAPAAELLEHFAICSETIVEAARQITERETPPTVAKQGEQ